MKEILMPCFAIALSGIFWRLGGKGGFPFAKQIRRYGVPVLIFLAALCAGRGWFSLFALAYIPMFSIGYGVDSKIGKLCVKNGALTRLVCGLLYCIPSIGLLLGNWCLLGFDFFVSSVGVMLAGSQCFKFNDNREEAFIGSLVAFCKVW